LFFVYAESPGLSQEEGLLMEFSVSSEVQDLLARVRSLVEKELYPLEPVMFRQGFRSVEPHLERVRAKAKKQGLWLPRIPKEYGGMGLSLLEQTLVCAELGKSPLGHYAFNSQTPDAENMEILIQYGSGEQRERYLRPLLEGKTRSCYAMTEPDHPGSNPTWLGTTAVKDGGDYVINGHKWCVTGGDGAAFAVVMAITEPDAPPHECASQIIVPAATPGFVHETATPFMGHAGQGWTSQSELRFKDCRVPRGNLLGEEGAGFEIAQERSAQGRIHHCMRWLGVCERSFDLMCKRSIERRITPEKPLAYQQFVQGWVAECRAEIDAARLLTLQAAWMIDRLGSNETRERISLVKFSVAKAMMNVIDHAIQVHGGLGVSDYTPLAFFYRNERAGRIYDGADEVHKISAAKRILKKYVAEMAQGGA
jgi:alkylation response protein AidB-like acyl-CoA dehydrogenase